MIDPRSSVSIGIGLAKVVDTFILPKEVEVLHFQYRENGSKRAENEKRV